MFEVSEGALLKRINRALRREVDSNWPAPKICRSRGWRELANLGEYYELDVSRNMVTGSHIDLVSQAKDLGVWGEGETLAASA